jgi:arylsulfatase A-like enzyme
VGWFGAGIVGFPEARGAQPAQAYNLILVSLTNTRADHLGAYGYHRNTSPNIDRLAKRSLVFRNAFGHASWTLPAAVSLFTSQYPFTHGSMNREEYQPLPGGTPTFVDVLKTNGYFTAAFVGDRDYSPKFGHTA